MRLCTWKAFFWILRWVLERFLKPTYPPFSKRSDMWMAPKGERNGTFFLKKDHSFIIALLSPNALYSLFFPLTSICAVLIIWSTEHVRYDFSKTNSNTLSIMSTLKRRRPAALFLSGERCSIEAVRHLPSGRFARRRQFVCFDERRASLWTFQTGRILFLLWSFTFFEWCFRRRRWWKVFWWLFRGRFFPFVWSSFWWVGRSSSFPEGRSQRKINSFGQVILHLRQNLDTNHRNWNYTVTNCFKALAQMKNDYKLRASWRKQ